jgi:hypothetical protein
VNGFHGAQNSCWGRRIAALLVATLPACAPKIGDHCSVSTDCSPQGDRLCDSTQPGGYCTVFNCEPNGCPDQSVCVAFNEGSCLSIAQSVRFQRTFCMATCEGQGDCRAGYVCLDVSSDPARRVIDINPSSRRICTYPPAPVVDAGATVPAVCLAPEAGAGSSPGQGDDGGVDADEAGQVDGAGTDQAGQDD